ncbi:MAG TPA: DNA invertase, partial [Gammaproteobacteria bacterium]|nr:DNA invertase [Gammaproteobacteria bacterium]
TKTEVAQHFGISRTTLNASLARLKKASVNSSINEQAPQG